jgi:hypothetical protein
VTIDGFWVVIRFIQHVDRQRVTILHNSLLNTNTHTHTHTLVFTVTSLLSLLGSEFQQRTFPFSGLTNFSCLSYQPRTATADNDWAPQVLYLTATANCSSARTAQKKEVLRCSVIVTLELCFCWSVTYQKLLYSFLFIRRCLTTGLHAKLPLFLLRMFHANDSFPSRYVVRNLTLL